MHPAIEFFHPNTCHVCKVTSQDVRLKRCKQCRIVAYCSSQHQKRDWKYHKELCKTIVHVSGLEQLKAMTSRNCTRLKVRSATAALCELFLGRKLDSIEMNMVYFQKSCSHCDSKENLQDCPDCLTSSVCSNHLNLFDHHKFDCDHLKLCLDAHLFKSKKYRFPVPKLRQNLSKNYVDMDSFITSNLCIDADFTLLNKAMISDLITRPLTVLYALKISNYKPLDNLSIHVVGSDNFESSTAHYWSILRHLLPIKTLHLSFIGPDIKSSSYDDLSKEFIVKTSSDFYHEFAASSDDPAVIVAFNCGLHEFEGDENDTWGASLSAILSRKIPVVLTSYTASEAVRDVTRLRKVDSGLRVRQIANPFASLTPLRDCESSGVYFVNSALSILTPS